jgi:protein-disulfide isomerase
MAKRARTLERKKEREQEKRRNQQIMIVGAIIAIVIFIAAAYVLTSLPSDAPLPTSLARYDNLRKGFTNEGYPRLGNPNAPVTLKEFSSFACPGCLSFEQTVFPNLLPRIERGEIQFIFVPLATGSVRNPDGANRTALCAGEQGKFWEMHDTLFFWHETFGSNAFEDGRLRAGIEALDLSTDAFNSCFRNNNTNNVLSTAVSEDVSSTPTLWIDGAPVETTLEAINTTIDAKGPFTNLEPGTISQENNEIEATAEPESTETMVEATAELEATEAIVEATAEASESGD